MKKMLIVIFIFFTFVFINGVYAAPTELVISPDVKKVINFILSTGEPMAIQTGELAKFITINFDDSHLLHFTVYHNGIVAYRLSIIEVERTETFLMNTHISDIDFDFKVDKSGRTKFIYEPGSPGIVTSTENTEFPDEQQFFEKWIAYFIKAYLTTKNNNGIFK